MIDDMDEDKPLVWLHGEVKTPPFSLEARVEAGMLLRRLQGGQSIGLPHRRSMPSIGKRCHELSIVDKEATWRIVYRTDADAIVIGEVFPKKTNTTPKKLITPASVDSRRMTRISDESIETEKT